MQIINTVIERNAPICDGTPRSETGYRPFVETSGPDLNYFGRPMKRYWRGPLFAKKDQAMQWRPNDAVISE
jgi:hypothetical protein